MLTEAKSLPDSVAVVRSVFCTADARLQRDMEGVVCEFSPEDDPAQQLLEIVAGMPTHHNGPLGRQQANLVCHYHAQRGDSKSLSYTPGGAQIVLDGRYGQDPSSAMEREKIASRLGFTTITHTDKKDMK